MDRKRIATIHVKGRLTYKKKSKRLRQQIRQLLTDGYKKILIDLTGCTHIGPVAIIDLWGATAKASEHRGQLQLMGLRKKVCENFPLKRVLRDLGAGNDRFRAIARFK